MKRLSIIAALLLSLNACQAVPMVTGAVLGGAVNQAVLVPQLEASEKRLDDRIAAAEARTQKRLDRLQEVWKR